MTAFALADPLHRAAVAAIDAGDASGLWRLLATHPRLAGERLDCGEGYFHRPYLLWLLAENPLRNGTLPQGIVEVTRVLLRAVARECADSGREQVDYALALVCSGRVARECGVQRELIDVLAGAGADPAAALVAALAHREADAAVRLLERGAPLTLLAAACSGRTADVARLLPAAGGEQRQMALAGAALHGQVQSLALLVAAGVDASAYGPAGFHPHATALHHAVDAGSLETVKVLVAAGARLDIKDRVHQGTPLDWAQHLRRDEIAAYLRAAPG